MNYYEIGQRIRKYRKALGLSQEQLAEKTDISVTHMSHIETGNTKLSLPVLVALSRTLGVQTDDLLCGTYSGKGKAQDEIIELLNSCDEKEVKIMLDILRATKSSFDKYR